jgi:hypothetical protein
MNIIFMTKLAYFYGQVSMVGEEPQSYIYESRSWMGKPAPPKGKEKKERKNNTDRFPSYLSGMFLEGAWVGEEVHSRPRRTSGRGGPMSTGSAGSEAVPGYRLRVWGDNER